MLIKLKQKVDHVWGIANGIVVTSQYLKAVPYALALGGSVFLWVGFLTAKSKRTGPN